MSKPVVLTHEAAADFDAAADWYQVQAGLGSEFTARVREALNFIGQHGVICKEPKQCGLTPHKSVRRPFESVPSPFC
jgi:hypothetical protein